MRLTTVLFDLDGTLLPMDQDVFVKAYMKALAGRMASHGYDPEALVAGLWKGTGAMVRNDGRKTNEAVFWEVFSALLGQRVLGDMPLFDDFYRNDFQTVRASCGYTEESARAVAEIQKMGLQTALATNPIFPQVATYSRIRWAGLRPEDFRFITTYENSRYCKPNLDYYREILEKLDLRPQAVLMVGNDVSEDMVAEELGMGVFLLTPCIINREGQDTSRWPQGDFGDLLAFLREQTTCV